MASLSEQLEAFEFDFEDFEDSEDFELKRLQVRARQRIEVMVEGPQPVLLTAREQDVQEHAALTGFKSEGKQRPPKGKPCRIAGTCRAGESHRATGMQAPHNIYLRRDGQPPHIMEELLIFSVGNIGEPPLRIPGSRSTRPS